jgi:H+-transporting ATPase
LAKKGLGVITRAVEEARRIFERMTSYATYRITETIRLLLFISLSILAFNSYPVTAIQIVLLAILNDIPILTIASVLGVFGVISIFIVFIYVRNFLGFPQGMVQTMMFLKLQVAGHMTIFLTRNLSWLWDRHWPNVSMFLALEGTQIVGTLVAVYGWLVAPNRLDSSTLHLGLCHYCLDAGTECDQSIELSITDKIAAQINFWEISIRQDSHPAWPSFALNILPEHHGY